MASRRCHAPEFLEGSTRPMLELFGSEGHAYFGFWPCGSAWSKSFLSDPYHKGHTYAELCRDNYGFVGILVRLLTNMQPENIARCINAVSTPQTS